jgi:hypothetical protein
MNSIHEDDIDALLRQSFDGPTPDAGFCDRVMQRLPQRRRRSVWPLVVGVLVGTLTCWLSLLTTPLWRLAWRDWLTGELSASMIVVMVVVVGMSLLALGWTLAEADDH